MATNTYVALKTTTVTTAVPSVTLDLTGITGYTDLVLVSNAILASGGQANLWCRFNGDTGGTTNYSTTYLAGNGSTATSSRDTSAAEGWCGRVSSTNWTVSTAHFQNYSNSTTYKTSISRGNDVSGLVIAFASLWRQTTAISSITLTNSSAVNFSVGSTFTVYGIANADNFTKATGGIISEDSTYTYHVFGASGTFTPKESLTADILVIAGGGGGGSGNNSGGGGAGGLLGFTSQALTATSYTVTIGAGGATGTPSGVNGADSQFGSLTLVKGGGYGGGDTSGAYPVIGGTGGSGGGSSFNYTSSGGAATSGQGYAGGAGQGGAPDYYGGGGGGSAEAGNTDSIGYGGDGLSTYSSWGLATATGQNVSGTVYYAGGGGGSGQSSSSVAQGGLGGGGNGAGTSAAVAGTPNTGGGGGGSGNSAGNTGKAGGSGIVIIRYPK